MKTSQRSHNGAFGVAAAVTLVAADADAAA
jgi:hypothetical protein